MTIWWYSDVEAAWVSLPILSVTVYLLQWLLFLGQVGVCVPMHVPGRKGFFLSYKT